MEWTSDNARSRHVDLTGEEEEEDGNRRKRQPPVDFQRSQFGVPVHHAFGNARNAADVLMQGAREAALKQKQANPTGAPQCRVCETPLGMIPSETCRRCRRVSCAKCIRPCDKCYNHFCAFCSTNNYAQSETRVLCIDCDVQG